MPLQACRDRSEQVTENRDVMVGVDAATENPVQTS